MEWLDYLAIAALGGAVGGLAAAGAYFGVRQRPRARVRERRRPLPTVGFVALLLAAGGVLFAVAWVGELAAAIAGGANTNSMICAMPAIKPISLPIARVA